MPDGSVRVLPPLRVRERQAAHEGSQFSVARREKHEVPVIGHEAPVEDATRHALVCQNQHALKREVVIGLLEQPQAAVGAIQHMINDSAGSLAGLPGHEWRLTEAPPI